MDLVRGLCVVRTRLLLQRGDVSVEAGGEHGFGDGRGGRLGVPRRARVIRPPERGFRVKPLLRLSFVVTFPPFLFAAFSFGTGILQEPGVAQERRVLPAHLRDVP